MKGDCYAKGVIPQLIFTTMAIDRGRALWPGEHVQRLQAAASMLGGPLPQNFEERLRAALQAHRHKRVVLRVEYHLASDELSLHPRPWGHTGPLQCRPYPYTARGGLHPLIKIKDPQLWRVVLPPDHDLLLTHPRKGLLETRTGNIFGYQEGWITPPLEHIYGGLCRQRLLAFLGSDCREAPIHQSIPLVVTNAVYLARPVSNGPPLPERAQRQLEQFHRACHKEWVSFDEPFTPSLLSAARGAHV